MQPKLHVLLVEDSENDALLLKHQLESAGFDPIIHRVESLHDLRKALQSDHWDVIISDHMLPNFTSRDALKTMKEAGCDLPFIIVSGSMGEEAAVAAMKAGAHDYFVKGKLARLTPAIEREMAEAESRRQRLRFEQELHESQDLIQKIAESVPELIYIYDLAENRMVYINKASGSILGITPSMIVALGPQIIQTIMLPEDAAKWKTDLLGYEYLKDGEVFSTEYRMKTVTGDVRFINTSGLVLSRWPDGKPKLIVGSGQDITENKRANEIIRETKERLHHVINTSPAIMYVLNMQEQRDKLTWVSDNIIRLTGFSPEQVLEPDWWITRVHPEDKDALLSGRRDIWRLENSVSEYRFLHNNGHYLWLMDESCLVRDAAGNPVEIVGFWSDISERKKLEMQFLRAQRLESIGTLAGGIAHDLNNILTPMTMSIDILAKRITDDDSRKMFETLKTCSKRAAALVHQVLTFARGMEGQKILLQPRHLIDEMIKISKETFPMTIRFEKDIHKELWPINGDPTQLHQVLLNLCVNARDAMPAGGLLQIRAQNVSFDEHSSQMNIDARPGPYVMIEVADSGTGIPRDIIDKIFDPFFTTKKIGKGTGLGLSTTMSIVKSHGGFINVYTETGKGTSFKVYFPVATSFTGTFNTEEVRVSPAGSGETILLVEDEVAIREITKRTLEAYNYKVIAAKDGTEALSLYAQFRATIDLVLTDMMMPFLDGSSMVRALRNMAPEIKVIVVSGLTSNEFNVNISDLNVTSFLSKPYSAEILLDKLHEVFHKTL